MKITNKYGLKQEFFDKLVELGVYDKWENNWKNNSPISRISQLNNADNFYYFIGISFVWIDTPEPGGFWYNIANS